MERLHPEKRLYMMIAGLSTFLSFTSLLLSHAVVDSVDATNHPLSPFVASDSTRYSEQNNPPATRAEQSSPRIPFSGAQSPEPFGYSSQLSAAAVESLIVQNPGMKKTILKELLMPTGPPPYLVAMSQRQDLLHQIDSLSRMTPFELMGLRAKRYQEVYENPIDKRMLLPQADIFGFIRWLAEIMK